MGILDTLNRIFRPWRPAPPEAPTDPSELMLSVNARRQWAGRAPLVRRADLDALAAGRALRAAARYAATGLLTHETLEPVARARPQSAVGECLSPAPTAQGAADQWANDPPHRGIMLGPYVAAGVGVGTQGGRTVWSLLVAS